MRLRTASITSAALLSSACLELFEPPPPCERVIRVAIAPASGTMIAGDRLRLTAGVATEPKRCTMPSFDPTWTLIEAPEGAEESLRADKFIPEKPGRYRVRATLGEASGEAEFIAVELLSAEGEPPAIERIEAHCTDVELHGGYLLCANSGISVIDLQSGDTRGRTAETVPASYGVATRGDLFVTAAFGCGAPPNCDENGLRRPCCPSGQEEPGGIRIYSLDAEAHPRLESFTERARSDELVIDGDRLYVVHHPDVIEAFDIRDPTQPRSLGCGAIPRDCLSLGTPMLAGDRVLVATWHGLVIFGRSDLERGCETPVQPRSLVPYRTTTSQYLRAFVAGDVAYFVAPRWIRGFALAGEPRETGVFLLEFAEGAAVIDGTLYVVDSDRLLEFVLRPDGAIPVPKLVTVLYGRYPRRLLARGGQLLVTQRP